MAAMKETIGIAKHSKIPQEHVQPLMLLNRVPTFQTWVVVTLPRIPVTTSSRASQSKPSFATVTERGDNPNSTHFFQITKKNIFQTFFGRAIASLKLLSLILNLWSYDHPTEETNIASKANLSSFPLKKSPTFFSLKMSLFKCWKTWFELWWNT